MSVKQWDLVSMNGDTFTDDVVSLIVWLVTGL